MKTQANCFFYRKIALEATAKSICAKYAKTEVELQRLKVDNDQLNDERIASNVGLKF